MVRFKNRHLLVEFLSPQSLAPGLSLSSISTTAELHSQGLETKDDQDLDGLGGENDNDDDEDDLPVLPPIPFLIPSTSEAHRPKLGDESGSTIYRAIKQSLLDVFGDEGWGRVSSSFKVIYHSPLTTLTILRVSRAHYRTLWAALTLLRSIDSQPILPRVVAISGTIKKLQNRAIAYHRGITAQALAVHLEGMDRGDMIGRREEEGRMRREGEGEREAMGALQD